ncbi:hypothetical protein U1Q18_021262, partial [Sarracenia purpurea var. burkii]
IDSDNGYGSRSGSRSSATAQDLAQDLPSTGCWSTLNAMASRDLIITERRRCNCGFKIESGRCCLTTCLGRHKASS